MLLLFWKILSYFEKCFSYFVFSKIREAFLKIREAFPNIILLNTKQNLRKSGPEEVPFEATILSSIRTPTWDLSGPKIVGKNNKHIGYGYASFFWNSEFGIPNFGGKEKKK